MQRVLSALLLALIVVGAPGVTAVTVGDATAVGGGPHPQAATPIQAVSTNTTHLLTLDTVGATSITRASLSVTDALAAQTTETTATFDRYVLEARFDRASNESAREAVLRNATDRASARVEALHADERDARLAYTDGDSSATSYLETLGRLDRQATALTDVVGRIDDLASRGSPIRNRADQLRVDLETFDGPIRSTAGRAIDGDGRAPRTSVMASTNGFVLADRSGGTYRREAVRWDNRDRAVGSLDIQGAQDRFSTLYPWAWAHKPGGFSIDLRGPDVWKLELRHEHGRLQAYLDMSSGAIYEEVQEKTLRDLPTAPGSTTTLGDATLAVSDTYPGGPVRVSVTNATGGPLDAPVTVNGTAVGQTGDDGAIWAISPRGTYNVSTRHDSQTLAVTVHPTPPPTNRTTRLPSG